MSFAAARCRNSPYCRRHWSVLLPLRSGSSAITTPGRIRSGQDLPADTNSLQSLQILRRGIWLVNRARTLDCPEITDINYSLSCQPRTVPKSYDGNRTHSSRIRGAHASPFKHTRPLFKLMSYTRTILCALETSGRRELYAVNRPLRHDVPRCRSFCRVRRFVSPILDASSGTIHQAQGYHRTGA
jgi:hypothetical protein